MNLVPDWWSQDHANIAKWMADGIRQVGKVKFEECEDGFEYACYCHDQVSLNLHIVLFGAIEGWKMSITMTEHPARKSGSFRTLSEIDQTDLRQVKEEATKSALSILDYMAKQTGKGQQP